MTCIPDAVLYIFAVLIYFATCLYVVAVRVIGFWSGLCRGCSVFGRENSRSVLKELQGVRVVLLICS